MGLLPRRTERPRTWMMMQLIYGLAATWALLFGAVALTDRRAAPAAHALRIALGTQDPFAASLDAAAVALAVFSFLLVPAVTGAVVALALDEQLRRSRPLSIDDLDRLKQAMLEQGLAAAPTGTAVEEPPVGEARNRP